MDKIIFKLFNRETGDEVGCYTRSYHTEYEFSSVDNARSSNVHGIYQDKEKYRIAKYKVNYELLDDDL